MVFLGTHTHTHTGGIVWSAAGLQLRFGGDVCVFAKVEEGSAAATVCLQAGDEMVSVNAVPLSGSRQQAISLVKSSHKTLTLVVRRYQHIERSYPVKYDFHLIKH